jgi:Cu-Zn family superoxide dismutase
MPSRKSVSPPEEKAVPPLLVLLFFACDQAPGGPASGAGLVTEAVAETTDEKTAAPVAAVAVLVPTQGNETRGSVVFTRSGDRIHVAGEIRGLSPGEHGFHVHQWGNCNCPDAECAGPHFAPREMPHGAPANEKRHVGDLGNVTAKDGEATVKMDDSLIALDGPRSIVGRAIVVHQKPDDLKSQPSGNAGPRVACGVVGIAR